MIEVMVRLMVLRVVCVFVCLCTTPSPKCEKKYRFDNLWATYTRIVEAISHNNITYGYKGIITEHRRCYIFPGVYVRAHIIHTHTHDFDLY